MTNFNFMMQIAAHFIEALGGREITDGEDEYGNTQCYKAEPEIANVGKNAVTIELAMKALTDGSQDRTFTVRVSENA